MGGGGAGARPLLLMVSLGILHLACPQTPTDVPPLAAILLHGAPLGDGNISNFHWRARREVQCEADEYKHPGGTFCCKKCIKGFRKVSDCKGKGQVTGCSSCEEGSFTEVENYLSQCMPCEPCNEVFGQVVLSPCTASSNIICGCPEGKFQVSTSSDFFCKNCTQCSNGRPHLKCAGERDTICQCNRDFFNAEGACRPCNECLGSDHCRHVCPPVLKTSAAPVLKISANPEGTSPYLIALVAVLVGVLLMAAGWIGFKFIQRKMSPLYNPVSPQQCESEATSQMETGMKHSLFLPGHPVSSSANPENSLYVTCSSTSSTPTMKDSLPDCVTEAEKKQLPMNPKVLYAVVDNVPVSRWKEFVRRLGLSDSDIERCVIETHNYRDAQYEMLQKWRQRTGAAGTTVEVISRVLREMDLSGCSEAIQDSLHFQP